MWICLWETTFNPLQVVSAVSVHFLWMFKFPLRLTLSFVNQCSLPFQVVAVWNGLHQGPPRVLLSYIAASLFVLSVDCIIFK